MHRTEKAGLGAAYVAGFAWALERDYAVVVEMDADGSHAPEDLPRLLDALERRRPGARLALRARRQGRQLAAAQGAPLPRRQHLLQLALGAKVNDITGGYRAYRSAVLEKIKLHNVASQGYCFQIDLAWRAIEAGFTVVEVPITFTERAIGESKMSGNIVREALWRVTKWGVRRRGNQLKSLLRRG